MSEQNASVAQTYAIAARFSERARRAAAAQRYVGIPNSTAHDKWARMLPRTTYRGGQCYCPLGILLVEDGYTDGSNMNMRQPTPEDVARYLTGLSVYTIMGNGSAENVQHGKTVRDEANAFTRSWDRFEIRDLAAALGLVPPSADETHGDEA